MRKLLLLCALLCILTACGSRNAEPSSATPPPPAKTVPEPEAPSAPPPASQLEPEPQPEEPSALAAAWSGMLTAYQKVLEEIYAASEDPEQSQYENGPSFALFDADLDGTEELIVQDTGGSMADKWVRIYGYDETTQTVYVELEEFPSLCFYDNGMIEAMWSHNQGAAGDKLWPYTLYQYSQDEKIYKAAAAVDGWDKSLTDKLSGISFPDDADADGDGFVYYIITEEGGYAPVYGEVMDNADYEAWRESRLQGASPTGPNLVPLTEENIARIA